MEVNSRPLVSIDYKKPPEELVVELINKDNGTKFTTTQISFGIPKSIRGKHNSELVVQATKGSYFTGKVKLKYNRIDIEDIPNRQSRLFLVNGETTLADLIPAIDARFNLNLTPADYINIILPTTGNGPNEKEHFFLEAAETSLVFINKVRLEIERAGQVILSTVLKNLVLSGLVYTKPVLNSLIDY